jgi:LPPG:FO 2-phospho-L-lactate transferase
VRRGRRLEQSKLKIVALAGGVGGAKLAHGLAQILPPEDLTVIVNTAMTLSIMPLYLPD